MGTQKEFIRYHLRNLLLANRRRISGRRKFFVVSVSRQVKLTPKKPDALEEIALLFVSSRNAPPHKGGALRDDLCGSRLWKVPGYAAHTEWNLGPRKKNKMAPEIGYVY